MPGVFPDYEKALIAFLRGHAGVATAFGASTVNVATEVQGPYPMLQVVRAGGAVGWRLDHGTVFVKSWGDPNTFDRGQMKAISTAAVAALQRDLPGSVLTDAGVSFVQILTRDQWTRDPDTNQPSVTNTVQVHGAAKP